MSYVELQTLTNFTFLEGASHPQELAVTAAALGMPALGIADRNSLAGVVRAHMACKRAGIRLLVGARLDLTDGPSVLCFPRDRAAYGRLSQTLTLGRRRAPKGQCHLSRQDLSALGADQVLVVVPPDAPEAGFADDLRDHCRYADDHVYLAAAPRYDGRDGPWLEVLAAAARAAGLPLVATNAVVAHTPDRKPLQDVLTCVRLGLTIDSAGWHLAANAERHLKAPEEMARLFRRYPDAIDRTLEIAAACTFSLDELRYDYPSEVPDGQSPQTVLERLTWQGAAARYGVAVPDAVAGQLRHELALIDQLGYASYFLTVHDIVRFARSQDILCQGRGSAANSAVCYVLGITAVDPARADLLFERFVSPERNEPPDIDVDFEHERREEVIQYIYRKYGRDRTGLTATVISYRARGALRDVGKAMGLSVDAITRLSKTIWGWGVEAVDADRVREAGLDPDDPRLARTLDLVREVIGFPRHLSQHVGGFVIARDRLDALVPIENAAMDDRTVIQWDKDDLDALRLLKVDVLGLGMLSCLHRAFNLIEDHYGRRFDLATVPPEDAPVYDMLCRADSLGVFQVESRAQMTMLPRLKPRNFYDLVIEVAIVRPGPIQGDMVHPYLRRRNGEEAVSYPSDDLRRVLEKTLGVPLFQEQAMQIAIVAAGFTPPEADQLRRSMATFKKIGDIHKFGEKMVVGMVERGYDPDFALRCFKQIEGFGTYGFPESHAASFALLVYVSAWVKCNYPDVFAAALLNSQPMGFYAPAQIVRDARDHGVTVHPPDINHAAWDCTLEPGSAAPGPAAPAGPRALRLGLRLVKGLAEAAAKQVVETRQAGGAYADVRDLWRRAGVSTGALSALAQADAFRSVGLDRRAAQWAVAALGERPLPLFDGLREESAEPPVRLPAMSLGEHVVEDYARLTVSLKAHPVGLLRDALTRRRYRPAADLQRLPHGATASVAGLVLVRQRPGSANGVIFITLEDEGGVANLVVMPPVFQRFRTVVLTARLLGAVGRVERVETVIHLKVDRLIDLSDVLARLTEKSDDRDFDAFLSPADEVRRPVPERRELQKSRNFR